jgi:hypothetical protein
VASKSLVQWLKILWENWGASAWRSLTRVVFCCLLSLRLSPSPAAGGFVLLLYIKEGANHMRAALFSYVREGDVLCCRVGGRPDDPRSDPAIMACLVPEQ